MICIHINTHEHRRAHGALSIRNPNRNLRLPVLGRVLRGFPGNGLGTFFIRLPPPGQRSSVTSTDAATTRRPFEWLCHSPRGLARACVWRQFFTANGQPVVAGLVLCRRQIPSRGRIQKVPFRFPARSGSLNLPDPCFRQSPSTKLATKLTAKKTHARPHAPTPTRAPTEHLPDWRFLHVALLNRLL